MNRVTSRRVANVLALLSLALSPLARAQDRPDLTGMWSDPAGIEDTFCLFWCTDAGLERLNALLDDPANDERPVVALYAEAAAYQREHYVFPLLTPAAVQALGIDPADDPGFLECEPWAFAREVFAPHQLKIEQRVDGVELLYGEWTIRRTIHIDDHTPPDMPSSPMGYSVGRYENGALVVETTAIAANLGPWGVGFPAGGEVFDGRHSDRLHSIERYTRSDDGQRLILSITLEDPWALTAPVTFKKVWHWAPDQEIAPYEDCTRPTEFSRGVTP
jgi:hypothetical protein